MQHDIAKDSIASASASASTWELDMIALVLVFPHCRTLGYLMADRILWECELMLKKKLDVELCRI